jgi:hypothetical protein
VKHSKLSSKSKNWKEQRTWLNWNSKDNLIQLIWIKWMNYCNLKELFMQPVLKLSNREVVKAFKKRIKRIFSCHKINWQVKLTLLLRQKRITKIQERIISKRILPLLISSKLIFKARIWFHLLKWIPYYFKSKMMKWLLMRYSISISSLICNSNREQTRVKRSLTWKKWSHHSKTRSKVLRVTSQNF